MKNIPTYLAALIFSILFYKQGLGLNLSLFSLLSLVLLYFHNKERFHRPRTIAIAATYVLTAITVFINDSSLAIFANCISFFTLIGSVSQHKSSIYLSWLNGLYTAIAAFFHRIHEASERPKTENNSKDIDYLHWVKLIGIPLVVLILFIGLYKKGNPLFNELIASIDFSIINMQWILFTVLGYYLFSNISNPICIEPVTSKDLSLTNDLTVPSEPLKANIAQDNQLGMVMMSVLNLLILFFLVTEVIYQFRTEHLAASQFSAQVHNGINALIASIIFAILIILYFFRGDLNFYKKNKQLKTLTYIWIALNTLLVISIAIKNGHYIQGFGFTYKRIGVLVYLLLTTLGLFSTLIKVLHLKNLLYLLRFNSLAAFTVLVLASCINWDKSLTQYNLNTAEHMDMPYLIQLSNNNVFLLKDYSETHNISADNKTKIDWKYDTYLEELKYRKWQEWTYDSYDNPIMNQF